MALGSLRRFAKALTVRYTPPKLAGGPRATHVHASHMPRHAASHRLLNIDTVRTQARQHIEPGAVTFGCRAKRTLVLDRLNDALAPELGGESGLSPDTLSQRSHAQYLTAPNLPAMVPPAPWRRTA